MVIYISKHNKDLLINFENSKITNLIKDVTIDLVGMF